MMNADKTKVLIGMSNTMLLSRSVANGAWDMGWCSTWHRCCLSWGQQLVVKNKKICGFTY